MQELLTDDEIVAVAGAAGRSWPVPLLTVAGDERAVNAAAFRGIRALTARGLSVPGRGGATGIAPELVSVVSRIADARRAAVAHVSGIAHAGVAGAVVAAFADDEGVLIDTVSATGIHALGITDLISARGSLLAFASTRFRAAVGDVSSNGCVLVAVSGIDRVVRITPGRVEVGRIDPAVDGSRFEPEWTGDDVAVVERLLEQLR